MKRVLTLMLVHSVFPLAFSFAAGTYAGSSSTTPEHRLGQRTGRVNPSPSYRQSTPAFQAVQMTSTVIEVGDQDQTFGSTYHSSDSDPDRPWKGGETNASLLSRLLFRYAEPLLRTASARALEADDCFNVSEDFRMDHSVSALTRIYENLQNKSRRLLEESKAQGSDSAAMSQSILLTKALLLHQRRNLMKTGLLRLLNTGIQALPAILVSRLLRLIEAGNGEPVSKAIKAALSLLVVLSFKMLIENKFFHEAVKCSTQVRGSLAGMIFDKSLRLSGGGSGVPSKSKSGGETTGSNSTQSGTTSFGVGGVLNLMQSDTSLIESAALQIHTIWDGPLQIAVYTSLLYRYLGPPVFWGIGVLLLTIPTNSVVLRLLNRLSKHENEARDARTRRTSESISNMKLLKLQGWENHFANDIRISRAQELRRHVTRGGIRAVNQAISNAVPALVLVVTLTAYIRSGKPLLASTIFTAISLFNQLRFPLFFYPMLIDSLANGRNSIRRISSYLGADEIAPYVESMPSADGKGYIELSNGNFLWPVAKEATPHSYAPPALLDAHLSVRPGEVVAVIGEVGSGKTTLIKALLGELEPVPRAIVRESLHANVTFDDASLPIDHPRVVMQGNVAYCSQEAWLPKGSIRDAIVFGREFNQERYDAAIHDACLDKDIGVSGSKLSHDTDVGEGGSALSGGQRARVALARALYSDRNTTVFLLDDVLAALDANVGSLVFERLTKRLKEAGAAAILVTNDPSIPRRCDRVILVGKVPSAASCSSIIDMGTYDELLSRGHDLRRTTLAEKDSSSMEDSELETFHQYSGLESLQTEPPRLMKIRKDRIRIVGGYKTNLNCTGNFCHADPETQLALENCPDLIVDHVLPLAAEVDDGMEIFPTTLTVSNLTTELGDHYELNSNNPSSVDSDEVSPSSARIKSVDDSMSTGAVTLPVYLSYFKAVRQPLLIVAMIASYVLANGAQFAQQLIVADWTKHGANAAAVAGPFMRSLVRATGLISVFLWLRSFLLVQVGVRASEYFHSRMLSSVFAAPMHFFDSTQSGSLLSRFGKEIESVDRGVPDNIGATLFCFLQIFMSMGGLASVVTPIMLVPLALVGFSYGNAMSMFRPAARNLKRVETKTRSPIYTHFGEALKGSETIRAFRQEEAWSDNHRALSETNLSVFYTVKALDRWLSTRLETLGNVVVFTAAMASIVLTREGRLLAGSAGWGLTQALAITGLLTWAVRCLTDLETSMLSVVRVEELIDVHSQETVLGDVGLESNRLLMPKEHGRAGDALLPLLPQANKLNVSLTSIDTGSLVHDGWPWHGNVQFRNVSMRYNAASPLVLKGVTLIVPAGTTLGVVGRTGSGKSSLLLSLFRIVEIENGGTIEVDGVDIRSVSLDDLRKSLAIIPQDPVLFAGTLAFNLDATGRETEEAMWKALHAASPTLALQFRQSNGLQTMISEAGKNLSLGQRQLICLARALLRKSKVLVLDEATSSVDTKTDEEVQATIRREFVQKGATVITVAHRLDTVLGYDKIAVLGNGRVIEYGSPDELLRLPRGELRQLVEADRRNKRRGSRVAVM